MDTIAATASWYHDEKLLPFYLQIYFFDPGYNSSKWENPGPGYSMLFNLHTAKLITMEESIVHNNGKTVQYVPVDVASKCRSNGTDEFLSADR
jgi:hypothetical protein